MRKFFQFFCCIIFTPLLLFSSGYAAPQQGTHVTAELISPFNEIVSESDFELGLHLVLDPDWHAYWKYPGDSGTAPKLNWSLPETVKFKEILWTYPKRIETGPLVTYGYEKEVLLPLKFSAQNLSKAKSLSFDLEAEILVCKEECIPSNFALHLTLPIISSGGATPSSWNKKFTENKIFLPIEGKPLHPKASISGDLIRLSLEMPRIDFHQNLKLEFFPDKPRQIDNAQAQKISFSGQEITLELPQHFQVKQNLTELSGIILANTSLDPASFAHAFQINAAVQNFSANQKSTAPTSQDLTLLLALAFALLGGLILNLMPCVFPVLSIKILGFVAQAKGDTKSMRLHGISFALGVLTCCWGLAGLLLILKASGQNLGWGFQLQNPVVVYLLALLTFLIGLNFMGVFEFGKSAQELAGKVEIKSSNFGSFMSGMLAVILATPCTAPFMGAALAYAIAQPAFISLLIFTALGLGIALPYIILSFSPNLLKLLPRPGAWMDTLKQFLAFPMFATTLWLGWVLSLQAGADGLVSLCFSILFLSLAAWICGHVASKNQLKKILLYLTALSIFCFGIYFGLPNSENLNTSSNNHSQSQYGGLDVMEYSETKLAELLSQNRSVYVDFTAAWCITCQVNKKLVFTSAEVISKFREKNIAILKADWTNKDAKITEALAKFDRAGVPLNIIYNNGKDPVVLPSILTPSIILGKI